MPLYKIEMTIQEAKIWIEAPDEATAKGVGIILHRLFDSHLRTVHVNNQLDAQRKNPDCTCGTLHRCPVHNPGVAR